MPYMHLRNVLQRSFLVVLGLVLSSATIVYVVSPLRQLAFVATSSNAGSYVPWAAAIPERAWTGGGMALAGVLSANLVLLLLLRLSPPRDVSRWGLMFSRVVLGVAALITSVAFAYLLYLGIVWYLLAQAIVD